MYTPNSYLVLVRRCHLGFSFVHRFFAVQIQTQFKSRSNKFTIYFMYNSRRLDVRPNWKHCLLVSSRYICKLIVIYHMVIEEKKLEQNRTLRAMHAFFWRLLLQPRPQQMHISRKKEEIAPPSLHAHPICSLTPRSPLQPSTVPSPHHLQSSPQPVSSLPWEPSHASTPTRPS
jgi:hypothetical protein